MAALTIKCCNAAGQWVSNISCTSHLDLWDLSPLHVFQFSKSGMEAKNVHFQEVPRWFWCCWSGDHTLRTETTYIQIEKWAYSTRDNTERKLVHHPSGWPLLPWMSSFTTLLWLAHFFPSVGRSSPFPSLPWGYRHTNLSLAKNWIQHISCS